MSAELAARRTAAAAAVADFRQAVDRWLCDDSLTIPAPDWQNWAYRLAFDVELLLGAVEQEVAADGKGSAKRAIRR